MSKVIEATMDNIDEIFSSNSDKRILVYIWCDWCEACAPMSKIFSSLSEEREDVLFVKGNLNEVYFWSNDYDITRFPAFMLFEGNRLLTTAFGYYSRQNLMYFLGL